MNDTASPSTLRPASLVLWGALAVGLAFRLAGLSHDLHDGHLYHPDTPKQMRAAERYIDGTYYAHTGLSDYDGYPLFHAHVIEWLVRAYGAAAAPIADLMGLPYEPRSPPIMNLYWLARFLNVAFATLLIFVVYRIGHECHSRKAGLMAAWLLALSPVDMSSAHYETGDTTASFFAGLTVLFAVKIFHHGRYRDYVWAGLSGMCAFASKYHAGMALIPVGLAHLLRQERWPDAFSARSLKAIVVLVMACVAGLFIAIPSMFDRPAIVLDEIWAFLHHVSSGNRLPDTLKSAGALERFAFSMQRHIPILTDILSWPVCAAAVAGLLLLARRDRRMWVLYAVPLVYFLVGVTLRPLAHPVYHTLMTPILFVIAALVLARIPSVLACVLLAWSCWQLCLGSMTEACHFRQQDTRRIARDWTRDNVPRSFVADPAVYAFDLRSHDGAAGGPEGRLRVLSSIRRFDPPPDGFLLKRFRVEDYSIPFFRNPVLEIFLSQADSIRANFHLPSYQRIPAQGDIDVVTQPDGGFIRSRNMALTDRHTPANRRAVSEIEIQNALVVMRNGALSTRMKLHVAGKDMEIALKSGEVTSFEVDALARSRRSEPDIHVYPWRARVDAGCASAAIAFTPEEKAVALYNHGRYIDAIPWLVASYKDNGGSPALAAMALLASYMGEVDLSRNELSNAWSAAAWFKGTIDEDSIRERFGISPAYMRALPYLEWEAENLPRSGFSVQRACVDDRTITTQIFSGTNSDWRLNIRSLALEPGAYTLDVRARVPAPGDGVRWAVKDGARPVLASADVQLPSGAANEFKQLRIRVYVPEAIVDGSIVLAGAPGSQIVIDRVSLAPDPVETLRGMAGALRVAYEGAWEKGRANALMYGPLLSLGNRMAKDGFSEKAFAAWSEVARLRPNAAAPLDRISRVRDKLPGNLLAAADELLAPYHASASAREFHAAEARFRGGVRLLGYRIRQNPVRAGEALGLNVYWDVGERKFSPDEWIIWMHIQDFAGHTVFQGDYPMLTSLSQPMDDTCVMPRFHVIPIPAGIAPGQYRVRTGLYHPGRGKRLKVAASALTVKNRGVVLPLAITIAP